MGAAPCPAVGLRLGARVGEMPVLWGFGSSPWGCAGVEELEGHMVLSGRGTRGGTRGLSSDGVGPGACAFRG